MNTTNYVFTLLSREKKLQQNCVALTPFMNCWRTVALTTASTTTSSNAKNITANKKTMLLIIMIITAHAKRGQSEANKDLAMPSQSSTSRSKARGHADLRGGP